MSDEPVRTSGGEIVRRAGVVATGTLTSRILGAIRDAVVAAVFALGATDAFWLAFTIPNALRVLLGEGAVSAAFVPVFTEVRERESMARARQFYGNLIGAMALVLLVVTVVGIAGAPWIVKGYAWGFQRDEALFETTVTLTRLLFPYIFLMGISALMMGALYASKRFAAPAFAPALLNISLITAALLLAPLLVDLGWPAIFALAAGALLGGVLQIAAQLPSLRKENLIVRPRIGFGDIYVRKCARLMVPLLAGLGVYQLNVLLSRLFASFLPTGSVSYLYYGQRLAEIPQGMFALAIASAALPALSDAVAKGDEEEAKRLFRHALRLSLFVAVPSAVALAVLAEPAATVFFGRGHYDAAAIHETTRSLVWQAAGIWAVASVRTIVPMFHAHNDTRTPVIASAFNLVAFVTLSFVLMGPMQHAGLAAATSAAAVTQLVALLWLLHRRSGDLGLAEVQASVLRIVVASAVMGGVVWAGARLGQWSNGGNDPRNVAVFAATAVAGLGTYLLVAAALGSPELRDLKAAIQRRVRA
ncbi:MAG: murein biosynthesis integral membrane protein MurJ [Deltaproteobacteria bacterium]|nr:murein biosynthesis integral membrane protein MurJ [Deltaproteobacteria bacterium]MBW1873818.1 murein biosynthesis integral membrane protein MurJ [Deltaproteobacteria bacterium]MBW2209967.1 murein biosynthesis integral membrane protein MurJ [Deltaproteobacteria bacterium]MBW2213714.1 murein biosynthesis integral membrane protein MurJ [Deltaproteobacteria bacterium]MBW2379191.1 murein biosynthesis integral membrane protein MurJ [Deltaproteobacteria bacterium]